ncbi:MAG: hypothetical protein IPL39_13845 [Opitutaceae bacterium]|nr:hypothetical protein [Opitutaceae bacterium]
MLPLLLTGVGRADDMASADRDSPAVRGGRDDSEDDGPPPTLTLAQFKKAVAKVQMPGFQRMPELAAGAGLGLILVGENESGVTIMGHGLRTGEQFEKGAAGKLSRFKHQGHEAFFAELTDDEGEKMALLIVQYPEHKMSLMITGKPVMSRAELMKLLAQVEL